jgi:4-amino-4-deoxy-L-arabinose transferase-like glycosyltransferase
VSRLARPWPVLVGAVVALAAVLRFHHIAALGPFYDEAANILTSIDLDTRRAINPLAQGRPLLALMFAPAALAPAHALLIGRCMVAAAGLVTTLALGTFLAVSAGRVAAIIGMLLWALSPFVVFHERLALQDPVVSMLLMLALAAVALSSLEGASRARRLGGAVVAGVLFGIAGLVKVSALLALPWLALVYVVVNRWRGSPILDARLACLAGAAALPFLALGPRLFGLGRWLRPLGMLPATESIDPLTRARLFLYWYGGYEGVALIVLVALALGWSLWRRQRWILGLAAAWLVTVVVCAAFYARPYARYAHPDHIPLVLFIACGLALAWTTPSHRLVRVATAIVAVIAGGSWLVTDAQIARRPLAPPVPIDEVRQYVDGAWSGVGLAEIRRQVAARTGAADAVVVTHYYWTPASVGMVFVSLGDAKIRVLPHTLGDLDTVLHLDAVLGARARAIGRPMDVFLLFEPPIYPPPAAVAELADLRTVTEVDRGHGNRFVLLRYRGIDGATARARIPVQRKTTDGWIGPKFEMALAATREFRTLRVTAETPPEFAASRPHLTFAVDGRTVREVDLGAQPSRFTVDVPILADGAPHTLRIESDRWFTPAEFGGPDDGRVVVVRLLTVEARR